MDYSQFLAMRQEIGLLIVFLLVFLYDTFMPKKALNATAGFSTVLFLILRSLRSSGVIPVRSTPSPGCTPRRPCAP